MALMNIGAFGNCCDNCNIVIEEVIWVPALNWGMCKNCYNEWVKRAKYYEEDRWYEETKVFWLEDILRKLGVPIIMNDQEM